jgi:hypothetical protein
MLMEPVESDPIPEVAPATRTSGRFLPQLDDVIFAPQRQLRAIELHE